MIIQLISLVNNVHNTVSKFSKQRSYTVSKFKQRIIQLVSLVNVENTVNKFSKQRS